MLYKLASWVPIDSSQRDDVADIVRSIATRYVDPDEVQDQMIHVPKQEVDGITINNWSPLSLGNGFPGICLLLGKLDELFPDEGWDLVGHKYLKKMQSLIQQNGIADFSLFDGLAGILIGIEALSRGRTRYQGLLHSLLTFFEEEVLRGIKFYKEEWLEGNVKISDYDVISGFAGIGRAALNFSHRPKGKKVVQEICELFHILCIDKLYQATEIPRWHIKSEEQFLEKERSKYPNGNFNLSLSHGIAGPLAFLSLAVMNNISSSHSISDIRKMVEWLSSWEFAGNQGRIFPGRVSLEEFLEGSVKTTIEGYRDSWCYGVPGITRSIWLAGRALNNKHWLTSSHQMFLDVEGRMIHNYGLTSDIVCHGTSGLLQCIQRIYSETGDEQMKYIRDTLVEDLISSYDSNSLFGYYDQKVIDGKYVKMDEAGFLNGSAGIAVVLASLLDSKSPSWDAALLLQ
ncbi:lanthionine synthetase C family protein [Paenibacillus thiaminolyticus]|uniref:Lanthionine synthetase C family protein n=1 Tax=Paenibacillus thiaminolyticus TaxID=49283 RepID=A0AAP9DRE1_PANTH|nr:lanthionine synthetase C family protein [Paenibacillus thiaminolyticus]MCY9537992.1 lanthionine synthetase C family protein [Paenibacillus thiaminolyticus]MCY9604942.1 lanthionine synthetase C family protein [Paenibacillus thiaminolyticus]MCY9610677.1 lanthionine synthetase C family protein [Paenibacillus thiaminolyticus]MCY9616006.1 lanthionine synthetase C family protein [Paenibacillus thiaminolyticus]MCY9622412.1 lanthionine synthetase C family protein [Paenibacillus thiaminolyticus]